MLTLAAAFAAFVIIVVGLMVAGQKLSSSSSASGVTRILRPANFTIVNQTFNMAPGEARSLDFKLEAPGTLKGSFYVAGQNWNDARVIVTDRQNAELLRANVGFRFFYDSGAMRQASTTTPLPTGEYVLTFSNRHSLVAQAAVTASYKIEY
jgi:hypothetical protein